MENFLNQILFDPIIGKLITVAIGIIVIARFLGRGVSRYTKSSESKYKIRKLFTFISYLLVIVLITVVYSDKLGGLTVALGVAGAGIAFALQEVIASAAGWIAISVGNFYNTGDRVQLGGIKGDAIDIGILRTTIMEVGQWVEGDLYNGRVVRVANSFVFKEPVFNYSGDFPFLWDEIKIPVRYGSDFKYSKEIFKKIAVDLVGDYAEKAKIAWGEMVEKYLIEDASVEPMVTLVAHDNWINYTIRYVIDYNEDEQRKIYFLKKFWKQQKVRKEKFN